MLIFVINALLGIVVFSAQFLGAKITAAGRDRIGAGP
jgi:hypothetical protein